MDDNVKKTQKPLPKKRRRTKEEVLAEPKKRGRPRRNYEWEEARVLVRAETLRSVVQYHRWWKINTPAKIPKRPDRAYTKTWLGWSDFLGTNNTFPAGYYRLRKVRSFVEARSFAQQLQLKDKLEWLAFCRSGNKPKDIPTRPDVKYRDEWFTWGDFLGKSKKSIQKNLEVAKAIFFIIQNYGRPSNVYQLGITLDGKASILQHQIQNRFKIVGLYNADISFEWEDIAKKYGRLYQDYDRTDEYSIANINQFIFDIGDFVTRLP